MKITKTRNLTGKQFNEIDRLWNDEYPVKLRDRFPILLNGVENYNHYLVEDPDEKVIAWTVNFEKDNEIRFSVIVSSDYKGQGLGRLLMDRLKADIPEFFGWVIDHDNDLKNNGEKYLSPLPFYLKNGFTVLADQRLDSEMIKAVKVKWKRGPSNF